MSGVLPEVRRGRVRQVDVGLAGEGHVGMLLVKRRRKNFWGTSRLGDWGLWGLEICFGGFGNLVMENKLAPKYLLQSFGTLLLAVAIG